MQQRVEPVGQAVMLSVIFREKGCDRLFEVMSYVLTSKKKVPQYSEFLEKFVFGELVPSCVSAAKHFD